MMNFIRIFLLAFASAIATQGFAQKIRGAIGIIVTLPVQVPIQVKLDTINAVFYQIPDTIITDGTKTDGTNVDPRYYFQGTFRNKFIIQNKVHIWYFIRSDKHGSRTYLPIVHKTNWLLSSIDSSNVHLRDSIVDSEYKRYLNVVFGKNKDYNSTTCFPEDQIFQPISQDKKQIFNADSVVLLQRINPVDGCVFGLIKELLIYKKNLGYILLQYSLVYGNDRRISFSEASALLDTIVQQTWGMIRFKKVD